MAVTLPPISETRTMMATAIKVSTAYSIAVVPRSSAAKRRAKPATVSGADRQSGLVLVILIDPPTIR
jgi:hypothetical protein